MRVVPGLAFRTTAYGVVLLTKVEGQQVRVAEVLSPSFAP